MKPKYSYCIDEDDNLVCINEVTDETRHAHKWRCLQCGQEMEPKLGLKRIKHFSHKADTACDGESYLHKLAKRKIREKFEQAGSFPITFVRDVPCSQHKACLFFHESECQVRSISTSDDYDFKKWYDTCQEEVNVGEFRPDLLLTCSTRPNRNPVFIEIYKTHQSDEAKRNSEHKIIETIQLKSEADVEDIVNNGFVEGKNCQIFNFNPNLPPQKKGDVPITRFVLFRNGTVYVHKELDYAVCCDKLNEKVNPNSICELNIKGVGIELWGENAHNKTLDSYESGLIYLIKKKNWQIKNCILCRFRKYNEWYGRHICTHYKLLGQDFQFPQQTMADKCNDYQIDPEKMDYPLSELEKIISEVPT